MRWPLLLPLLVPLVPAPASALKPAKHRSIAEASCRSARLPDAFCRRMGQAVFETDFLEWEDLSAHAQTQRGQDRCSAAEAAVKRVDSLARSVISAASSGDAERAADDLGRALHTIQDECAHHGMTNEQHAFLSIEQTCGDEDVSPDIQPAAIACATERTAAVIDLVAPALARAQWINLDTVCRDFSSESNNGDSCASARLPSPHMACDFLAQFADWNGNDSTWDGSVVGTALIDAFAAGVRDAPVSPSVCGGNATAIDPPAQPVTDVAGADTCGLIDVGCLGSVHNDDNVDPYGEESHGSDDAGAVGGCSTAYAGLAPVVAVFGMFVRRRRRRLA